MMASPCTILGMTSRDYVDAADGRAHEQLAEYRGLFRTGAAPGVELRLPEVAGEVREGETIKFLLSLENGLESESVIIPMKGRDGAMNHTLCVSSQVGCAMGCTFCETGRMGLLRNLSAAEIIAQWFVARHHYKVPIRNIVFMGMGEPMENMDAVIQAIRIFTDRNGPAIAPAHIAVSTVGRIAGIDRYRELACEPGLRQLKLAISINAPNDAIRSTIMPINRAEPMGELRKAMERWCGVGRVSDPPVVERLPEPQVTAQRAVVSPTVRTTLSPILIEYVLIPGVNDLPEHADGLVEYLRGLACKANVIPYNPRRDSPWPAPSEESVQTFIERLRSAGLFVKRRRTLGRSVMAACGQLGNENIRRRRFTTESTESTEKAKGLGVRVAVLRSE